MVDHWVDFKLRSVVASDLPFLEALYGTSREEFAGMAWSSEQKAAFLKMQFSSQHQYYQTHFPQASFDVIHVSSLNIGRRYVCWGEEGLTIIDLTLLPEWRGRGIGTALLRTLLGEAASRSKPVLLHVEVNNPAGRLYARLGFVEIATDGVYQKLRWQ